MTVVADRHMVMAGLLPRVHMILHHMAVHAALRIVAQVTGSLTIAKRKHADS